MCNATVARSTLGHPQTACLSTLSSGERRRDTREHVVLYLRAFNA